jgi:Domain of Unknown Function (DUF1206)
MAIPEPARVVAFSRAHSPHGVVLAARVGYAAEAVVYAVLGVLALMAAFGLAGGKLTDNKGALQTLGQQPFGTALLWASALGMVCYALWNGVRAARDPERRGTDGKALVVRVGFAASSLGHLLLAFYAAQLAYGSAPSSGRSPTYVGKLLSYPFGAWLVAALGLIAIGFGIAQVVLAVRDKVGRQYAHAKLAAGLCRLVRRVARVGVFARGLVFPVIGSSLVAAAWRRDPQQADGFGEALASLARTPLGVWLLMFVAAGLLAYGIHLFFVARWGHLPEPD